MTNEELKKKIADIVLGVEWTGCLGNIYHISGGMSVANAIADALIAAGIVDKSDYASMKETAVKYKAEVSNAENREKAAEHRAEVAERALRIFAENCSCADCPFFGGCQIIPDVEDDFSGCFDMYLAIAEKDLMDERK